MADADVVVVGAGIGGATLALALARKGISVQVLEQAPAFKPIYKGEYLQPRSLAIFAELGLADTIRNVTHPVHRSLMATESGLVLADINMGDLGPYEGRNGHHRLIQGAVLDALAARPNATVSMGSTLKDLRRNGSNWEVETSTGSLTARFVAGADGRLSAVRRLLGIHAVERGYPGASLAATFDLDGEAEPTVYQLFGARDSAYHFPLANNQARLYLVFWQDEDYEAYKAQPDGGLAYFKHRLTHYLPHLRGPISRLNDRKEIQVIPAYHLLADRWVADGAALLGDAAHCVNPARGQGMNLAIADAHELAGVLERALARGDLSAAALAPYEQRRRPFALYIQRDAERFRRLFLLRAPGAERMRAWIFKNSLKADRAMRRLMAVLAGVEEPPSFSEELLMNAAVLAPPLDRFVSGARA